MESIRDFAIKRFQDQVFLDQPSRKYNFLTISQSRPSPQYAPSIVTPAIASTSSATIDDIKDLVTTSRPTFLLVTVRYDPPRPVHIFHSSAADLLSLVHLTRIDESGLGHVSNETTGFHRVSSERDAGDPTGYRPVTYYLYCGAYKVLWSYDARWGITRAIAFAFNTPGTNPQDNGFIPRYEGFIATMGLQTSAHQGYEDFLAALSLQGCAQLATHPLLIPLAGLAQTVSFTEKTLRAQYDKCRDAEQKSGVHPWLAAAGPEKRGEAVRELAGLARQMTAAVTESEMVLRRLRQWKLGVAAYEEMQRGFVKWLDSGVRDSSDTVESRRSVTDALHLHKQRLEVMELDFMYVSERARNQALAVTQMMTRDDALASIDLARAAARDGQSMKVVAIMTMAFLPGTFFAALFAVPSLQWGDDADAVIGARFWVYWAFTLPLTVMVFASWALLTQREELARLCHVGLSTLFLRRRWKSVSEGGGNIGKEEEEASPDSVMVVQDAWLSPAPYIPQNPMQG